MEASGNFSAASGKRPLLVFFAAESKIQRPAALLPAWGLIRQPRSPKRLGHRVAAGGPRDCSSPHPSRRGRRRRPWQRMDGGRSVVLAEAWVLTLGEDGSKGGEEARRLLRVVPSRPVKLGRARIAVAGGLVHV